MTKATAVRPVLAKDAWPATEELLRRVQGEFLEMPGLRLTEAHACRLWGLDAARCSALLSALIDARFLFRTRDGAFMRIEHALPVKATLPSPATGITPAAHVLQHCQATTSSADVTSTMTSPFLART
jgi:hypothetical protein